MAGEQCGLHRRQRPSTHAATENGVHELRFLVPLPLGDEASPAIVAKVDGTAGGFREVVWPDLTSPDQCYDETVRDRSQFLGKIECERRSPRPRAVEEPHLVVQADTLDRTRVFADQQTITETEHRVDGVARRALVSSGEPEGAPRQSLTYAPEIGSRRISLDASKQIRRRGQGNTRHAGKDGCGSGRKMLSLVRILRIPRPAVEYSPAVLELGGDYRPGQRQRVVLIGHGAVQRCSQMHVSAGLVTHHKANCTAASQCRHADAAPDAGFQSLGSDLSASEHHERVNRFERHALAAVRRGHE